MKNTLKGTLTEENLLKAFAGESQARNRYNFFASQASKDGYEQIAGVFNTTADQEREHAKRFFKYLEGGMATIHNASFPAGIIGTTEQNLIAAAAGEHEEWDVLYASFAETAHAEGFQKIALTFKHVAEVEKEHERRYLKLLSRLTDGDFFRRDISLRLKWLQSCALRANTNRGISSRWPTTISAYNFKLGGVSA